MIFTNAKLYGSNENYTIEIENKKIKKLKSQQCNIKSKKEVIDLKGKLVLPPFVESHIHLDYAFSVGDPYWNESGTLFEAIHIWSKRKKEKKETKSQIKNRATKAINSLIKNGVQHIRSHVDITSPELTGLQALLELKSEFKKWIDLQLVAFPQEGLISYPNGEELMEESIKMGVDALGAIPHYELTEEDGEKSIKKITKLASRHNKLIDVHCDEIDNPQSKFLEVLAGEAYKTGMKNMVTASHTTAMGSYDNSYTQKLFKLLYLSDINFIALPKANMHLQGRNDTYPKRRGITRVKELVESGMNVSFGLDSIKDPWYPLGSTSLINMVEFGLHATHMTGYKDIITALDFITTNGARTLNITNNYELQEGGDANFIVLDVQSDYEAIYSQPQVVYSVRQGEIILNCTPAELNTSESASFLQQKE